MDFDYKKYSLEKVEEWINDAVSCSEARPQEIYDVIKKAVEENYYIYKDHASRCYELLALLNGNGVGHISAYDDHLQVSEDESRNYPDENGIYFCASDDPAPYCKGAWNDFWNDSHTEALTYGEMVAKEDKVVKWQLPVESCGISGEYFVTFPDDLLEAANLKEGDRVEWIDNNDGTYALKKVGN